MGELFHGSGIYNNKADDNIGIWNKKGISH